MLYIYSPCKIWFSLLVWCYCCLTAVISVQLPCLGISCDTFYLCHWWSFFQLVWYRTFVFISQNCMITSSVTNNVTAQLGILALSTKASLSRPLYRRSLFIFFNHFFSFLLCFFLLYFISHFPGPRLLFRVSFPHVFDWSCGHFSFSWSINLCMHHVRLWGTSLLSVTGFQINILYNPKNTMQWESLDSLL